MSDQNTQLPVRSQADGTDERLHVKIVDGTTSPAVNQTKVDSDNNVWTLSNAHNPAGANKTLRVSEEGAPNGDGVYDGTNNSTPDSAGLITSSRSATPSATTQTLRLTGVQGSSPNTAWSLDVALHDSSGNPFTNTNPLPVDISASAGTSITDFKDASAIAAAASDNHDYVVTSGKTLHLRQVFASASGKAKMQVQTSPDGIAFTTVAVAFNSTADPQMDFSINDVDVLVVGNGSAKVRVIMTNRDNQAQDLYSTIIGVEE